MMKQVALWLGRCYRLGLVPKPCVEVYTEAMEAADNDRLGLCMAALDRCHAIEAGNRRPEMLQKPEGSAVAVIIEGVRMIAETA